MSAELSAMRVHLPWLDEPSDEPSTRPRIRRHCITAEQVFNRNRPQSVDSGAPGGEVIHRRHLQHGNAKALQLFNDVAAFAAG